MDLISREDAIEAIRAIKEIILINGEVINALYHVPTIESRAKGKWIKRHSYDRRDNLYACSECGRIINIICGAHLEDYPFCHCGADMRGEG